MEVSQKIYVCHLKIKINQYLAKYKFSSDNVRKAKFGDSKINSLSPFTFTVHTLSLVTT